MSRVEGQIVDPTTARLWCIQQAVRTAMKMEDEWPDWLIKGIERIEEGGVITPEWLAEQDKENSYI